MSPLTEQRLDPLADPVHRRVGKPVTVARVDPALDRRAGALEDAPGRPDPIDGRVGVVLAAVERDGRPGEGVLAAPVSRVLDVDPVEVFAR